MNIKFYTSIIFILILGSAEVYGQNNFRSSGIGTGEWNNTDSWEEETSAGVWQNTANYPTSSSGTISIRGTHTMTIPGSATITANQITVQSAGVLRVASGGILELLDESGSDELVVAPGGGRGGSAGKAEITGTLKALNASTISAAQADMTFFDGGTYDHAYTSSAGSIPLATWNTGSTVLISGYTSNGAAPGNLDQIFHHFTWNTPNLNTGDPMIPFDLAGSLTTIKGNLTVSSTGANFLSFSDAVIYTLTVEGNVLIENNSEVYFAYSQASAALNVLGNFTHTSSSIVGITDFADFTLDVNGDFTLNNASGTFDFATNYAGGTGNVTFNLAGNLSLTAGSFIRSSTAGGTNTLTFDGASLQTYSSSISITDPINYTVASNSILDLGTSALQGSGNFTLNNSSGLRLGSTATDGAWQNSTTAGNIQVSGTRTYGDFLTITYNGAGDQKTGLDFPETRNVSLIIDTENATSSVSLSENITITGTESLTLTQGTLQIGGNTLTLNGTVTPTSGKIGAITTSNLSIGGSGAMGTIPFSSTSNTLNNFTLARGSTGSVTLGGDLTVLGLLNFVDGQLILNGNTLTLQGTVDKTAGSIVSDNVSSLLIQGTGTLGDIPFAADSQIGTLTLDRTSSGSAGLAGNLTIAGTLNLNNGALTHGGLLTMADNATISRAAGGSIGSTPNAASGTSYNVVYTSGLTTGPELPASSNTLAALKNFTVSGPGTVTLNKNITTNGPLEVANGTLDLATHTVELKNNLIVDANLLPSSSTIIFNGLITVSGTTPPAFNNVQLAAVSDVSLSASTFTVAGNWENEGTFNPGSSTVTFNGNSIISGSAASSFHNVDLAGNLTAPAGNMNVSGNWVYTSGTFTPNGGTITFNGAGQNINPGGQPFYNTTFAGSGTKSLAAALTVNNDLTISSGSSLDISASIHPISVHSDWINNGLFVPRTGKVTFAGSALQTIGGTSITNFYDLEMTNIGGPPGIRAISDVTLTNTLALAAGVTFDPDGTDGTVNFHLSSYASSTASIATLPAGASINGSVVVERYIHAEGKIYRYIATPVTNAIVRDWNDDFTIRGNYSGATTTGSPTMYVYNEAVDGHLDNGWEAYPSGSITESLSVGKGFAAGMLEGNSTVVASIKGPVQQGGLSLGLAYYNSPNGADTDDGWNLVGNPYPSSIDLTKVGFSGSVSTKVHIPDNGSGSLVYATYDVSTGGSTNGGSKDIASGQAFWVKASAGGASLDFTENSKSTNTGATFFRESGPKDLFKIAINKDGKRDETVIVFRDFGTTAFDQHDGLKLMNNTLDISTLSEDGKELTYNYWPKFTCNTDVKIKFTSKKTGNFSMDFGYLETITDNIVFQLIDNYAQTETTISTETVYEFSVNEETASKSADRFVLRASFASLNSNLYTRGESVCGDEAAEATVQDAEKGVYYQLKQGTSLIGEPVYSSGGDVSLPIPASLLVDGDNHFKVQAKREGCETLTLMHEALIRKENIYEITSVTGASGCGTESLVLKAEGAPEGGSYRWYNSNKAGAKLMAETATSDFTTPELSETTYYFVAAVNSAGCESSEKVKVKANIEPLPAITEVIGASACGESSLSLQASADQANSLFRWYADAASTEVLAENNGSFTTPVLAQSTTYYVSTVSDAGCEAAERVAVEASIQPIPAITEVMGASACGESSLSLQASADQANSLFRWYADAASTEVLAENNGSFTTPVLAQSATYYVSTVSTAGCEAGERIAVEASILEEQEQAEIKGEKNLLSLSNEVKGDIQWYLDGALIEGATSSTYEAYLPGTYTVSIGQGVCSYLSNQFALEMKMLHAKDKIFEIIKFWPNPTDQELYVQLLPAIKGKVEIRMFNLNGRTLLQTELMSGSKSTLDLGSYAAGIYILEVRDSGNTYRTRISKKQ